MKVKGTINTTIAIRVLHGADLDVNAGLMLAVCAMAESAKQYCDKMISLSDHTLKDLADMGHPYSARNPFPIHDPIEQVHEQSGALRAGLEAVRPVVDRDSVTAYVRNNTQPLDTYIQVGTRYMIARPYMDAVRRLYHEAIEAIGLAMIQRAVEGIKQKWAS